MKKNIIKSLVLVVALLMVFSVLADTVLVFAASDTVPSTYTAGKRKIVGKVNLQKVSKNEGEIVQVSDKSIYQGSVSGSVEASDLFAGAYDKYVADFRGQTEFFTKKPYENLVMFDKGEEFPSIKYTVTFPSNFVVDQNKIVASENTATISRIETTYDEKTNSVSFRLFLGNWNDYKGFFELYETEKGLEGHAITIRIPYSVEITDSNLNLGTITATGTCELYKYGGFFGYGMKIVDVSALPLSINNFR